MKTVPSPSNSVPEGERRRIRERPDHLWHAFRLLPKPVQIGSWVAVALLALVGLAALTKADLAEQREKEMRAYASESLGAQILRFRGWNPEGAEGQTVVVKCRVTNSGGEDVSSFKAVVGLKQSGLRGFQELETQTVWPLKGRTPLLAGASMDFDATFKDMRADALKGVLTVSDCRFPD